MTTTFYRRTLPHWDVDGATYFSTMCLEGSTPARIRPPAHHATNSPPRPPRASPGQVFAEFDKLLDTSPPIRWLEDPRLAKVIADSLCWGAGHRYELLAYVVMPSHIHWVFTPLKATGNAAKSQRLAITSAFKSYTALACNRLLGRRGRFWQEESYDRVVRSEVELERIVRYVEHNPVRAGLCERAEDWEFSSAHRGRE
jgi:putative transposase